MFEEYVISNFFEKIKSTKAFRRIFWKNDWWKLLKEKINKKIGWWKLLE
jgi:hypothetical protein